MWLTRRVSTHGALLWWLALLCLAGTLIGVLAREAGGTKRISCRCPAVSSRLAAAQGPPATSLSALAEIGCVGGDRRSM